MQCRSSLETIEIWGSDYCSYFNGCLATLEYVTGQRTWYKALRNLYGERGDDEARGVALCSQRRPLLLGGKGLSAEGQECYRLLTHL